MPCLRRLRDLPRSIFVEGCRWAYSARLALPWWCSQLFTRPLPTQDIACTAVAAKIYFSNTQRMPVRLLQASGHLLCPRSLGGAFSDDAVWRLYVWHPSDDVCCVHRTQRPRKTKIGIDVAHVTCETDTTFKVKRSKVKGQGHQTALLTAVLAR